MSITSSIDFSAMAHLTSAAVTPCSPHIPPFPYISLSRCLMSVRGDNTPAFAVHISCCAITVVVLHASDDVRAHSLF